jgi:hypothetical protein
VLRLAKTSSTTACWRHLSFTEKWKSCQNRGLQHIIDDSTDRWRTSLFYWLRDEREKFAVKTFLEKCMFRATLLHSITKLHTTAHTETYTGTHISNWGYYKYCLRNTFLCIILYWKMFFLLRRFGSVEPFSGNISMILRKLLYLQRICCFRCNKLA